MTLSNRIRAAALGPRPRSKLNHLAVWTPDAEAFKAVHKWGAWIYSSCGDDTERRMFLLFVACALENP